MIIHADQPGSKPLSVPRRERNPVHEPMPTRTPAPVQPSREKPVPQKVPERVE